MVANCLLARKIYKAVVREAAHNENISSDQLVTDTQDMTDEEEYAPVILRRSYKSAKEACDLKCLLGELDADSLTTETIYSVLDDYKQLMDVAVETISANRFNIGSIELLLHVNESSRFNLPITLDKLLSRLWDSLQTAGSSLFSAFLDNMLLDTAHLWPEDPFVGGIYTKCKNREENSKECGGDSLENVVERVFVVNTGDVDVPTDRSRYRTDVEGDEDEVMGESDVSIVERRVLAKTAEIDPLKMTGENTTSCSEIEIKIEDEDSRDNFPHSFTDTSASLPENNDATELGNVHCVVPIRTEVSGWRIGKRKRKKIAFVKDDLQSKLPPPLLSSKNKRVKGPISATACGLTNPEAKKPRKDRKVSHTINFLCYKCFLCEQNDKTFISFQQLSTHIASAHATADSETGKMVLYCPKKDAENCSWAKSFVGSLGRDQVAYSLTHLIFNHDYAIPEYIQPFQCPHGGCTYSAIRKFNLDSHMACHISDLVACKDCGKMLKKRSMHLHKTFCEVVGIKVNMNACPVNNCDRTFKSKYTLVKHVKTYHENEKIHSCLSCKKSFVCKRDLAIHTFARHGVNTTGCPEVSCPACSFSTISKAIFRKHMIKVHQKIWEKLEQDKTRDRPQKELEILALEIVRNSLREQNNVENAPQGSYLRESLNNSIESGSREEKYALNSAEEMNSIRTDATKDYEVDLRVTAIKTEIISDVEETIAARDCSTEVPKLEPSMNFKGTGNSLNTSSVGRNSIAQNLICGSLSGEEEEDEEEEGEEDNGDEGKSTKRRTGDKKNGNGKQTLNFTRLQCFLCPPPSIVYKSITNLFKHVQDVHSDVDGAGRRGLPCPECSTRKQFKRAGGIDRDTLARILSHLLSEHKWELPEFIVPHYCPHPGCSFITIQHRNLVAHARRHAEKEKIPCDKCGKCLNPYSVRQHLTYCSVNVNKRKAFGCDQCEKTFTSKQGLQNHVLSKHEGIKNFLCTHCTMRFSTTRELEEHAFNIHRINYKNKPVLSCPECSFVTIRLSRLEKHRRYVHAQLRDHPCTVCNRRYKTSGQLKVHMRGHLEKSFKCTQCEFRTARKTNLEEHIQAQHLGKLFRCEFCGYSTGYLANLHKHLRISCQKKQHLLQK